MADNIDAILMDMINKIKDALGRNIEVLNDKRKMRFMTQVIFKSTHGMFPHFVSCSVA